MKHELILYIADHKMNALMKSLDLKPDYKWFVSTKSVSMTTESTIDEAYCMRIIHKSKETKDMFWIPAISYQGNLFVDPEVQILSDGKKEMFIRKNIN